MPWARDHEPPGTTPVPPPALRPWAHRGPFLMINGKVTSPPIADKTLAKQHPLDHLPRLVLIVALVLMLPVLLKLLTSLILFVILFVILPLWLLRRMGLGCLTSLLGIFLPRPGGRAGEPRPILHFRVETDPPDPVVRDVVLVGHQAGLSLGDSVHVTALRGSGLPQVLLVRNVGSGQRFFRQGLAGIAVSLCTLLFAVLLLLSLLLGGGVS